MTTSNTLPAHRFADTLRDEFDIPTTLTWQVVGGFWTMTADYAPFGTVTIAVTDLGKPSVLSGTSRKAIEMAERDLCMIQLEAS